MQKVLFASLIGIMTVSSIFAQQGFTLSSETLKGNATQTEEFNNFGCKGENKSPQLSWVNAPEGTKSFAITMYDTEAPTGSGWWHWVVFDIPATQNSIPEGAGDIKLNLMPESVIQSMNNYGTKGYGGPCPPENNGLHQYLITVHALDTDSLGLESGTDPAVVGFYLWNHTIGKASIVSYYQRESAAKE